MTLREAASQLDMLPRDATLFAERLAGAFVETSRVMVLELTDEELAGPITEFAARRTPGYEYFLEVSTACDVRRAWHEQEWIRAGAPELLDALVFYAENDAYPGAP